MGAYDSASGRATRGVPKAQHRADKAHRVAVAALADPRTTEELREAAVTAWARVQRSSSTRWDLTKFEAADDLYRARCEATREEYRRPSAPSDPNPADGYQEQA